MYDELTATAITFSPRAAQGDEERKLGVKLSLGRKERWGREGVFKIRFYFSLSYSHLIGNKLN